MISIILIFNLSILINENFQIDQNILANWSTFRKSESANWRKHSQSLAIERLTCFSKSFESKNKYAIASLISELTRKIRHGKWKNA